MPCWTSDLRYETFKRERGRALDEREREVGRFDLLE